jgi:DNA adenine methylase
VAKPFLKWPGSKTWLVDQLVHLLPTSGLRVVEPFAGSAAFFLGSCYTSAILGDTNEQVAWCLQAVRDDAKNVLQFLSRLTNSLPDYVRVRDLRPSAPAEIAGRLIFLTNTSWGGLYRENQKGGFNVPFGNNGRSFFSEETILAASEKLSTSEVLHAGFAGTLANVQKSDLVFVDAPYVTKDNAQYFDRYHATRFRWADQVELAKLLNGRKFRSKLVIVTCAADADLYAVFPGWTVFEFSKRNSMTASTKSVGYRREALVVSPALNELIEGLGCSARAVRRC